MFAELLENTKKLSLTDFNTIISNILDSISDYPIKELLYYYPLANELNKIKIRNLVTKKLQENFDVGIIINLVHKGGTINTTEVQLIHQLRKYLLQDELQNRFLSKRTPRSCFRYSDS